MPLSRHLRRRMSVLCILCASITSFAVNQPSVPDHPHYAIHHFGERFNLGSATVLAMTQDNQGFLWIGTETGLFRYDGNGVTRFGRAEGLPGELVELLLTAPDGTVWVRTHAGVARRVRERFEAIALPAEAGALRDHYQSIAVDQQGDVFVSATNGLLRLHPDSSAQAQRYDLFRSGSPAVPGGVEAIARAADDTIWFAAGSQIGRFRPGQSAPEKFTTLDLGEEHVFALLPAPDGKLWIRTNTRLGVVHLSSADPTVAWLPDNLPGANIQGGPSLDRHGNLLLPTPQGLYWRDGSGGDTSNRITGGKAAWRVIDHRSGLTSSAVASALEDREGGIWIGTTGTGLDYWPGSKQWSGWTDTEGLPDALILGVVRDHRGRLWVAANTAVCYWDPEAARWQIVNEGGARNGARQIKLTPDGAVWTLIAGKGIYRFDANQLHPAEQVVPLPADWKPHRIAAAPDSSIWADGTDSLHAIRYEHGHFTIAQVSAPAESAGTTQAVSVSSGGVVWSAGTGGVSRYDHGRWQHFHKQDGLLADNLVEVEAAGDQEAWLRYADESEVSRLRLEPYGHPNVTHVQDGMCALGTDSHQNTWLAMDEGAGVVSPEGKLHLFTQSDGLIWNDLNCGALWNESDGTILLGTSKGLARYDATQEAPSLRQPTIVLTGATFGRQERSLDVAPQIAYKDATFLARFASPVFHGASHVSCRYRLDPLETEFTETSLREARYSSLQAGDYTFRVSCGSPQLGQSRLASYSFTILPPWWQTWWARVSAVLGSIILLWTLLWLHQYRNRREKERLECAVAERSAALAQANRELQEVSLCDPLTGVRNRRFFLSMIAADASQAIRAARSAPTFSRDHRELIFFFVDIDHFKAVNDEFGHDAGDRVLVQIAARLSTVVRESDFLIRWGGEEFLVVCRSADRGDGAILAERILKAINSKEFDIGNDRYLQRSCSVGWAPFPCLPPACSDLAVDEVLRLADRGLYLAKQRGRNQAVGLVPLTDLPPYEGKYSRLEELVEANLIREVLTPGQIPAAITAVKQPSRVSPRV